MLTIQEYEKDFPTKMKCATFFNISWEQLRRYRILKDVVIDDKVYVPAIKRKKTLELLDWERK